MDTFFITVALRISTNLAVGLQAAKTMSPDGCASVRFLTRCRGLGGYNKVAEGTDRMQDITSIYGAAMSTLAALSCIESMKCAPYRRSIDVLIRILVEAGPVW